MAQNQSPSKTGKLRRSAIDGRTTRHAGYGLSRKCRKKIESIFGWGKRRGVARLGVGLPRNLIAYNLIRIAKLIAA